MVHQADYGRSVRTTEYSKCFLVDLLNKRNFFYHSAIAFSLDGERLSVGPQRTEAFNQTSFNVPLVANFGKHFGGLPTGL